MLRKFLRYLLTIALALLIVNLFIEPLIEPSMIFFPTKKLGGDPSILGLEYEDVYLKTGDGVRINGWFIPNRRSKKVILIFHGNGGNLSHRLDMIQLLHTLPANLFIIDYHGYGRSGGKPSEKNLYLDARASYQYLVRKKKYKPGQILVMGSSLGGAVAAELAASEEIGGLVLMRSFTSAPDMAPRVNPLYRWPIIWPRSKFDTIQKIRDIKVPKLIVHSRQDEMIPYAMSVAIFEKAPEPKKLILLESGKHNDLIATREYMESLRQMLAD